jgi:Flp pilus assembly pilin Flp
MHRIHKASVAFARFSVDDRGVTTIEYALIGVLVGVAIVGSVSLVGENLVTYFYQPVVDTFRRLAGS